MRKTKVEGRISKTDEDEDKANGDSPRVPSPPPTALISLRVALAPTRPPSLSLFVCLLFVVCFESHQEKEKEGFNFLDHARRRRRHSDSDRPRGRAVRDINPFFFFFFLASVTLPI